ncbi:MAG: hypothetical protein CMO01_01800 [Thalassobius sp.]|nr:hypothetical protein [Thalassovita sp.]
MTIKKVTVTREIEITRVDDKKIKVLTNEVHEVDVLKNGTFVFLIDGTSHVVQETLQTILDNLK